MNVEIGAEAALFLEKEYINGICRIECHIFNPLRYGGGGPLPFFKGQIVKKTLKGPPHGIDLKKF
jgi:hypothetical protein